ncbi:MAG: SCP2 sterol-binding domain-containing protein [Thermoleophilia bacterium]|nr:SCP2 sterol-binding domain-containing protein [Thermoleophilia bacterium]
MTTVTAPAHTRKIARAHAHARALSHGVPMSGTAARGHRHVATAFFGVARTALADMTVQERFATLQDRFDPSAAKGVDVRLGFDITGAGGGQWFCTIKGGKLTVATGKGTNLTATLHASSEDYLKIANGKMNKMWALVQGKLKVEGDKNALKQWDTYFKD